MRIALISDTHLGITKAGVLKVLLEQLKQEQFDILVHAGDYSGNASGAGAVKGTVLLMRHVFGSDKPIISTIGNHDFWSGRQCRLNQYVKNYQKVVNIFKEANVHFIDEDGPYTHPTFPEITFMGCSGWYSSPNPPTNDRAFLPQGLEGDTRASLLKRSERILEHQADQLRASWESWRRLVFLSHFPVVNVGDDYKGSFESFSWNPSISRWLQDEFECKYFLEGHSHTRRNGPLSYNCGSDYMNPKYLIVEV